MIPDDPVPFDLRQDSPEAGDRGCRQFDPYRSPSRRWGILIVSFEAFVGGLLIVLEHRVISTDVE
jgi:hypothetical protein